MMDEEFQRTQAVLHFLTKITNDIIDPFKHMSLTKSVISATRSVLTISENTQNYTSWCPIFSLRISTYLPHILKHMTPIFSRDPQPLDIHEHERYATIYHIRTLKIDSFKLNIKLNKKKLDF